MTGKAVVTFKRLRGQFGVPYSRTHLARMEERGKFPSSFKLSDHRNSPIVWWENEVIDWLESRAAASSDSS
ncbi:helix-turn-helix transcriptional regulator [Bradyrhizobium elkanii]|uniref:helix-turn-helix transcriptional regulator n=1 Tax=Bradyrhizobium elkanii TaxID=29448 RepID=UPI002227CD3A|nr:AlpA family transcriptional regulator [Bradyrhizobium elkanii]MCW2114450.1 putative DNA-binding transcriptional regulator AlpA [Bradyrhizobium elkanii]